MLNRPSKAAVTWIVGIVGALVALSAFLMLSSVLPDSALAHPHDPVQMHRGVGTDVDHIHYDENGMGPVRTFMSTDPETGDAVDWDITGTDADDFWISESGELTFKMSPDYEKPVDGLDANNNGDFTDDGDVEPDNLYEITVRATEQETLGDPMGRALSTEKEVFIVVNNMDEDGMVELNYLQPEVGTEIMAMLMDEDIFKGTITWEWSVSKVTNPDKDTEAHWAVVAGDAGDIDNMFTPRGDRDNEIPAENRVGDPNRTVDEGEYLRAKATYRDEQNVTGDDNKVAIGVSMHPVRAEVNSDNDGVENAANGSPGFPDGLDYTRTVPESTDVKMDVDAAVEADDPNDDTLSYQLAALGPDGTANFGDLGFFDIDRATGQISLARMLDHEEEDGRTYTGATAATAGVYKVIVMATDPSGETGEVTVTITATAANDDPVIRGKEELHVMEQDIDDRDGDGGFDKTYTGLPDMNVSQANDHPNVYRASDDDDRGQITWSFKEDSNDPEAADYALFERSSTNLSLKDEPRAIRFKEPPDYENPGDANRDNVYKLTLVATDGRQGGRNEFRISIFVKNQREQGELTLMASGDDPAQPIIGELMTATVSDPDGGIAVVTWQWSRSDTKDGPYTPIDGATSARYRPAPTIADDPDTTEDESSSGPDAGMFLRATATYIDTTSQEDIPDTELIDERVQATDTKAKTATTGDGTTDGGGTEGSVYRVMATTDKAVRVADTGPRTTDPSVPPSAPAFDPGSYTGTVYENSEVGSLVMISSAVSATSGGLMLDPLDSDDNKFFTINEHGQIRVGEVPFRAPLPTGVQDATATAPAMEDPMLDYETRITYRLVVSSRNEGGKSTANVTISLVDRNEHPYFDKASREIDLDTTATGFDGTIEYAENTKSRTVIGLAAVEPDEDSLDWEVVGTDSADFEIVDAPDGADGKDRRELRFKMGSRPDFERPMDRLMDLTPLDGDSDDDGEDAAKNNMYKITVRVTEDATVGGVPPKADELDLTVSVTNAQENGQVQVRWRQPEVLTPISASLTDPDEVSASNADGKVTTDVTYQWFRAKVRNPDRNIEDVPDGGSTDWEPLSANGATTETYTPQGAIPDDPDTVDDESAGVAVDEGWHLLAKATYDTDQTAIGISDYPVQANVHDNLNNSPDFAAAETPRTVPENIEVGMPVGDAVDVDRNEDNDILTYELVTETTGDNGNHDVMELDLPFFYIDKDTGQIRVKKPLNFEGHDDPNTIDVVEPSEYQVVVRATDPSGETTNENNRDDITVVITVTDVNEAPKVIDGYSIIQVDEMNESKEPKDNGQYYIGLGNTALEVAPYTITENANKQNYYKKEDEDPVDSHDWPDNLIPGPDGQWFEYSTPDDGISRRLHFIMPPDYEDPKDQNRDNVYEVCVTAIDNRDIRGCKMVRIEVVNVQEDGTLTLMPVEPVEETAEGGVEITATLIDPDGEVVITDWKWARNRASGGMFDAADLVGGKTTDMFTGMAGDFVWAQVHYRDGASVVDDPVTALDERNDDDPGIPGDTEQHKFEIADASPPDILFHNSDEMLSKVTDSAVQAPASEQDGLDTTGDPTGPPTGPPSVIDIQRMVPENTPSTGYVGIPLEMAVFADKDRMVHTMTGADANVFVFAEDVDRPNGDEGYYDEALTPTPDALDDKMGQLALKPVNHLDFEASKNSYIIEFSDDSADSDVYRVTILVTDVNEAPSMPMEARGGININGPLNIPRYDEGGTGMVATYSTTGGDVGAMVMWNLAGDDMDDFSIDANGVLTFKMTPDYEDPMDSNRDNIYAITVEADDGTNVDSQFVTVTVGNVNEDGAVTDELSFDSDVIERMVAEDAMAGDNVGDPVMAAGGLGSQLTYSLDGADASSFTIDVMGQIMVGTGTDLDYETKVTYTVMVTARGTADDGTAEVAMTTVTVTVTNVDEAEGGLLATYDSDSDGGISKAEFLAALDEYFDEKIEKDTLLEVLDFYFDS